MVRFWVMTSQTHALPSTFRGRARKIWLISSQSGFTVWQIQTGFPIFFCCQGLLQGKLYHETNKLSRLLDFLVRFFDNMKQIVKANVVELALILSWLCLTWFPFMIYETLVLYSIGYKLLTHMQTTVYKVNNKEKILEQASWKPFECLYIWLWTGSCKQVFVFNPFLTHFGQCSVSVPPENDQKPLVFWRFQGV